METLPRDCDAELENGIVTVSYKVEQLAKRLLPSSTVAAVKRAKAKWKSKRMAKLPKLSGSEMRKLLTEDLGIAAGDVVFMHSSLDGLRLDFPGTDILAMMLDVLGPEGTLLVPTYPKLGSYAFLKSGEVFDIRKTPSYMGLLTELARRHKNAVRSLHPTKSVVAIGRYARELTATHHLSRYPYSPQSPYAKIRDYNGKIIGVGVSSQKTSCVHCVEDEMGVAFPVRPYHEELVAAKCIDYDGNMRIVETYGHNMRKTQFDLPKFMKKYVAEDICCEIPVKGMPFFRADACKLLTLLLELARAGITIYPKSAYEPRDRERRRLA